MTQATNPIVPCLWFDDQAEAAVDHYVRIFPDSKRTALSRYPTGFDNPGGMPRGSVLTVDFEIAGYRLTALNGGPAFTPNPTISFFVFTPSVEETDRIATALADGGAYMMDLAAYAWSPRYAWVRDRYGMSWQVMLSPGDAGGQRIVPCLMFNGAVHGRAEEALEMYARVFPCGQVEALERYTAAEGPAGTIKHGRADLGGQRLVAMDSHIDHGARFNEAISLQVYCRDQAEVDHFWARLTDGGQEGPCGWLTDRFGVSWQVVPTALIDLANAGEAAGAGYERAFQAMLDMKKLDIAALQAAARGGH